MLALGPVGVRPDRQGQEIGSTLIRAGLEQARASGEVAVILLGSPVFYQRFGFSRQVRNEAFGIRSPV